MKAMERRLDALERAENGSMLSPAVLAWLGYDVGPVEPVEPCGAIDTSNWSRELKAWLGVD